MKIIITQSHLGPFVSYTFIRSTKATIIKINCKIIMGNINSQGIVERFNMIPPFLISNYSFYKRKLSQTML